MLIYKEVKEGHKFRSHNVLSNVRKNYILQDYLPKLESYLKIHIEEKQINCPK